MYIWTWRKLAKIGKNWRKLAKIGENWRKLWYDGEHNKIDRINAFYGLLHSYYTFITCRRYELRLY